MDVKLGFEILPDLNGFALYLVADPPILGRADGNSRSVVLQSGYTTPAQAAHALIDALTYAPPDPPDLGALEDAAAQIPQLMDNIRDANEAIQALGDRMALIEERLTAAQTPRATRQPAPAQAPPARVAGPPPLRGPRPRVSIGMTAGTQGLPITGRAFRPGGGALTGGEPYDPAEETGDGE